MRRIEFRSDEKPEVDATLRVPEGVDRVLNQSSAAVVVRT